MQHFAFGMLVGYLFLLTRNLWLTTAFHAGWNVGIYVTGSWLLASESSPQSPIVFKLTQTNRVWLEMGVILLAVVGVQILFKRRIVWRDFTRSLRSHTVRFKRLEPVRLPMQSVIFRVQLNHRPADGHRRNPRSPHATLLLGSITFNREEIRNVTCSGSQLLDFARWIWYR